PDNKAENDPKDSHRDAQIFHPPYLFRGPRPAITHAPSEVGYAETFTVEVSRAPAIRLISWIRLPSVTHANDYNQRVNFLNFELQENKLAVCAPERPEICPPGHYMLFVLDDSGIPSVAQIIHIGGAAAR